MGWSQGLSPHLGVVLGSAENTSEGGCRACLGDFGSFTNASGDRRPRVLRPGFGDGDGRGVALQPITLCRVEVGTEKPDTEEAPGSHASCDVSAELALDGRRAWRIREQ